MLLWVWNLRILAQFKRSEMSPELFQDFMDGSIKFSDSFNYLTVCSCHVTYAFQSESTLYNCLNVKELLARSRHEI